MKTPETEMAFEAIAAVLDLDRVDNFSLDVRKAPVMNMWRATWTEDGQPMTQIFTVEKAA